jgi:dCTP deaminase
MTPQPDHRETLPPSCPGSAFQHDNRHGLRLSASSIPDWRIRQLAAEGMISPFEPGKVRSVVEQELDVPETNYYSTFRRRVISYGCSSYGYDLTLSPDDFQIFQHVPGLIVDPKNFDERCLIQAGLRYDEQGSYFILPGHTYGLGVARERLRLPANVTAQFIGKSTYARCGVIVNLTPGEAGWEGYLTLEMSNSSGSDCRIYANEGICQALFYEGVHCDTPYGDGKYQGQEAGVTLARI